MPTARAYHAAATVGDRWYVAGGSFVEGNAEQFPTDVDVYNPTAGHWDVLGQLSQPGEDIGAIADPRRGDVLFSGRMLPDESGDYVGLPTCDMAAPGGVQLAPNLLEGRFLYAATFASGRFIVSGGWSTGALLGDAEVWDGSATDWMSGGIMPGGPRSGHTMTTLRDGRHVLVAGGNTSAQTLGDADVFDASCGTWSRTTTLMMARTRHKALLLVDGRVLVAGGLTNAVLTSVEIFDPSTNAWKLVQPMNDARFDFDMVLLPDGRVLAAGGSNNATQGELGALSSAEVYDPIADEWTALYPMHDRRRWPTLAVLSDGVYVAGGDYSVNGPPQIVTTLATVERLAWSDLGINGPIQLDAGAPSGYAADASVSCEVVDAGLAPDGGQGGESADSAVDAGADTSVRDSSLRDGFARDAGSSDRGSAGTKSGCSCTLNPGASNTLIDLAFALALGVVLRKRSPRGPEAWKRSTPRFR